MMHFPIPHLLPAAGWRTALATLGVLVGVGSQAYAADLSMQGAWRMAPDASRFQEAVTGPAPDAATLVVTRDDAQRFSYQLVERRDGAEVARASYSVSFAGQPSLSSVDGQGLAVVASRDPTGGVVIRAPRVNGDQAAIHMQRTGPDTAELQHEVETADGVVQLETIALVRMDGEEAR